MTSRSPKLCCPTVKTANFFCDTATMRRINTSRLLPANWLWHDLLADVGQLI